MKKILFLISFFAFTYLNAQISNEVTISIPSSRLPDNANTPTVSSLDNPKTANFVIEVPASLDNADDSLALVAIQNAVLDTLEASWLVDQFGIDTSLNISGVAIITDITRGFDTFVPGDFKNQYQVANPVFICTGRYRWAVDE